MRSHTAVVQALYEWADQLLTVDLACCRSPLAPRSLAQSFTHSLTGRTWPSITARGLKLTYTLKVS